MDIGGQGGEDFAESLIRKFENLEKKVRKMLDEEKKIREKQEAEKEKNLQKRLTTMEAEINQSLEVTTGITQALEERNNRIEMQFGRIEAQQTKIKERLNVEEERREEIRGPERGSSIKYILPEFRADTSPIRYINQLKQYWEAVKPRDSDTHYLNEEVSCFQTFLNKFLRRYWNEQAQHELRRKLEFGTLSGGRKGSRA